MKRFYGWMVAALCTLPVVAQSGKARLSGMLKGFSGTPVVVCSLSGDEDADTLRLSPDGSFAAEYELTTPREGYLSVEDSSSQRLSFCLYMAPGRSLTLGVTRNGSEVTPSYGGDTGAESAYSDAKRNVYTLSDTFSEKAWLNLADFNACRLYVETQQRRLENLLDKVADAGFVTTERAALAKERPGSYFSFAVAKEQHGTKMESDPAFRAFVKSINLNDTAQIDLVSYYLEWYMTAHPRHYPDVSGEAAKLRYVRENITNPDVRNRLADNSLMMLGMMSMFGADVSEMAPAVYREFLQLSTDEARCASIRKELAVYANQAPGAPAADLPMQTPEGKAVSLKEVVGKGAYTYVDFWATWCGPCVKEIPALEALAEQYKGKPSIRFVSISLDADEAVWKKKLSADKPAWEQYNIPKAHQEACAAIYGITGIPRFMLFDKEGNMLKASAPRPSDPAIKALLDSLR